MDIYVVRSGSQGAVGPDDELLQRTDAAVTRFQEDIPTYDVFLLIGSGVFYCSVRRDPGVAPSHDPEHVHVLLRRQVHETLRSKCNDVSGSVNIHRLSGSDPDAGAAQECHVLLLSTQQHDYLLGSETIDEAELAIYRPLDRYDHLLIMTY